MRALAREVTSLWLSRRAEQEYPLGVVALLPDPQPVKPAPQVDEPGGWGLWVGLVSECVAVYRAQFELQSHELPPCIACLLPALQPRLSWSWAARSCHPTTWWRRASHMARR